MHRVLLPGLILFGFVLQDGKAQVPRINNGGVVNNASYAGLLAPGVIFSIFGSALTDGTSASAASVPLPTRLAGARVLVNGSPVPLFFASPLQINAQFPTDITGATTAAIQVEVQSGSASVLGAAVNVAVAPVSPALFTLDQSGMGPGAVLRNGDFAKICPPERTDCAANPAVRGDTIAIYATGLGQVNGPWAAGEAAAQPLQTLETPAVTIGNIPARVLFSGLATGFTGLYQVNAIVPADAPLGPAVPLTVSMGGITSNSETIYVAPGLSGAPANITKVSGDNQTGTVGQPLANPFVVRVTDAAGLPVLGVTVTFLVPSGNGTLSAATARTDTLGQASSRLTLGTTAGNTTVTASSGGLIGSPLTFTATVIPGPPASMILQSGLGLTGTVGSPLSSPFVVKIVDSFGNPVGGVPVTFAVTAGGGTLSASMTGTNSQGLASTVLTLGKSTGTNTVTASVIGLRGSPATFTATAKPGPGAAISLAGGGNQTGAVGHALPRPFVVKVVDSLGNGVNGVRVTFAVTTGGGSLSAASADTNSLGLVSTLLTLGSAAVTNTVTASAAGLSGSPVVIAASAILSADLSISMSDGPDPVNSAGPLTYTISLSNIGSIDAGNAILTDTLPPGVAFVSCTARAGSCAESGGTVTAGLGTIPAGGSATITIAVTAPAVTSPRFITNRASVSTDAPQITDTHQISSTTMVNPTQSPLAQGGGPAGGEILAIQIDPRSPDNVYAIANGAGVFKSSNRGLGWTAVNNGLTPKSVSCLIIDPANSGVLYAGAHENGVFKTADGGLTWNPVNQGLALPYIVALAFDSANSAVIYAMSSSGVFKTVDGAASWNPANAGMPGGSTTPSLVVDPSNPATIYASGYKSTNGGSSWATSFSFSVLAIDPSNSFTLYTAGAQGISKSTDGGETFLPVNSGLANVSSLAIDASQPDKLYAGTYDKGIFVSTNRGVTWAPLNSGLTHLEVNAIAMDPSNSSLLYTGTETGGVFKTSDRGANWTAANLGLGASSVVALAFDRVDPARIYAATASPGGVFANSGSGAGWNIINSGLENISVNTLAGDAFSPGTVYAGVTGDTGVFKSTNGGGHWDPSAMGIKTIFTHNSAYAFATDLVNPGTIYAGTVGGVFKTTNGGASWTAVNSGLPGLGIISLSIDPSNPGTVYGASFVDGVFRTVNGGNSWVAVNSGLVNKDILSVVADPFQPATVYAGDDRGMVARSSNGGASWTLVNTGANSPVRALAVDRIRPGTLYAATDGAGVYRSKDGGATWAPANNRLPSSASVSSLIVALDKTGTIFAGTRGYGTFRSTDGGDTWQPTEAN